MLLNAHEYVHYNNIIVAANYHIDYTVRSISYILNVHYDSRLNTA